MKAQRLSNGSWTRIDYIFGGQFLDSTTQYFPFLLLFVVVPSRHFIFSGDSGPIYIKDFLGVLNIVDRKEGQAGNEMMGCGDTQHTR